MTPTPRPDQQPMVAPITTVFFDAAGTLIHLPRHVGDHYREVALRFAIDLSADELDRAFAAAWKAAPARVNTPGTPSGR